MCIFKTNFNLNSFNLADNIIRSINTSDFKYFNLLIKKNRNIKRVKTLQSIKLLNKIISDSKSDVKYINRFRDIINIKSIPRPKLVKRIDIHKYKKEVEKPVSYNYTNSLSLTKSIFGNKIERNDINKSLIMERILEIYPIELRSILFNFSNKHLYSMSSSELDDFNVLLNTHSENENSKLLDYILAKEVVPLELLENKILPRLLKFLSHSHPLLGNGQFT